MLGGRSVEPGEEKGRPRRSEKVEEEGENWKTLPG
jgi:hypothetical protein